MAGYTPCPCNSGTMIRVLPHRRSYSVGNRHALHSLTDIVLY